MVKVNALGKPCPIPVIEAKKAIRSLGAAGGDVAVLVDNDVSRQNVEKMAKGLGYKTSYTENNSEFEITITVPANSGEAVTTNDNELVVAFSRNKMGDGDDELGEILMKSFIYSLTELDTAPEHLLFFNGGAYLTNKGSNVLKDLQTLADKGTLISTCGTCLDFYEIKDGLEIGEITNMYGIAEVMAQAKKVINI